MDEADILLPMVETEAVLGDKAYDAQEPVIGLLTQRGIEVVIPPKKTARELCNYDEVLYKAPHLIENLFAKLKQYRGLAEPGSSYIATRYDKRSVSFLGGIPKSSLSLLLA
ncbi:hypothetical protein [Dapis sp. BLCC M229]|uniref:hypothetical protein n=1 Tax=Dapis sp. BLCC M229 TaxID=3400188 RepID=UPI003CFB2E4B